MFSWSNFYSEIVEFTRFLITYFKGHFFAYGNRFEKIKGIIVALLVVKRGKYSQSFLNTSFFLLLGAAIIAGPAIAQNNPFLADYLNQSAPIASDSVIDIDVYSKSTNTAISQKPRDRIIEYEVKGGDTIDSDNTIRSNGRRLIKI